jgi:hypothetical protein
MRIGRNEIIEELTEHIRNLGGEPGEWCVGTARDSTLNGKLPLQNSSETSPRLPGLAYREAHTPYAAAEAADYPASAFGLHPAPSATPEPGKTVFVYRRREVHQVVRALACHAVAT